MGDAPKLLRRPEARAFSVETLLQHAQDGKLRIPEFQRPQRWRTAHVLSLFDSVVRGFPIGEFLFSKQPAPADSLKFGPVRVDSPEVADALFIVDGQQRMTALAGAMLHPDARPRGDIHAIWYDLDAEKFERLSRGEPPQHWIPLNVVGDSFKLLTWLSTWMLQKERPELAKRAIALGKALREYQAPAYIVEGATEETLRLIFKRVNTSGVAMHEAEVFEALYGQQGHPVKAACARLTEIGFGAIDESDFLAALKAVEGLDPRSRFRDSEKELEVRVDAIGRTEIALRRTIGFLVGSASIPHIDLLPYRLPLRILARFFHMHPSPDARAELLLTRWIWRGALSGLHADNGDAVVEELQRCIVGDPDVAAEALLHRATGELKFPSVLEPWNGRSARTRLSALAQFALGPRDPDSEAAITVDALQALVTEHDLGDVFVTPRTAEGAGGLIVHRFLLEDRRSLERLLAPLDMFPVSVGVLASHGLDAAVLLAFHGGDLAGFERARAARLDPQLHRFFRERAAPDDNDRRAIAAIVARVEAEAAAG